MVLLAASASAAPKFTVAYVSLYQPNSILAARIENDPKRVAEFITEVEKKAAKVIENARSHPGASGAIVVSVTPGRQSRVWIVPRPNSLLPSSVIADLKATTEAVFPFAVRGGPVAVAVVFDAWGGASPASASHDLPIPQEWRRPIGSEAALDAVLTSR